MEQLIQKPPKGWKDVGLPTAFIKEKKSGPEYLCKYCGEINDLRSPSYHKPGCRVANAFSSPVED